MCLLAPVLDSTVLEGISKTNGWNLKIFRLHFTYLSFGTILAV